MNDDMEMDNATDFASQMMSIAGHSFQICRMKLDAESSAILSAACGASHPELIDDDRVDQIVHPVGPATFGNLWTVEFLISQCAAPVRYLLGHGPWQTILHSGSEITGIGPCVLMISSMYHAPLAILNNEGLASP